MKKKTGHDISVVEMTFTGDDKTLWLDWFHPTNEEKSYIGGTKHTRAVPLIEYPVYVRQGALLALLEDGGKLGVTDEHISFTWFAPRAGMNSVTSEALEPIEVGPGIQAIAQFSSESTIEVKLSAHEGPIGLTLVDVPKASKVDIRGLPCLNEYNPLKKTLDVKCPNNKLGTILTIEFN